MNKPLVLITGLGIGGGLMYLFDPDRGKRRRTLIKDKASSTVLEVEDAISKASRDLSNRTRGFLAEARSLVSSEEIPDDVLKARVESKIGRLATRHGGIDVDVDDGNVTLQGPVLSTEVRDLIRGVSAMRGVRSVRNRLEIHDRAEDIAGSQGGSWTATKRVGVLQANWSPGIRLIAGAAAGRLFSTARRIGTGWALEQLLWALQCLPVGSQIERSGASSDSDALPDCESPCEQSENALGLPRFNAGGVQEVLGG